MVTERLEEDFLEKEGPFLAGRGFRSTATPRTPSPDKLLKSFVIISYWDDYGGLGAFARQIQGSLE